MKLFPRRALVALGLAVGAVAMAAAPAGATTPIQHRSITLGDGSFGEFFLSSTGDPILPLVQIQPYVNVSKPGNANDYHTCYEVWVNVYLSDHYPLAMGYTCKEWWAASSNPVKTIHYPNGGGAFGNAVPVSDLQTRNALDPGGPTPGWEEGVAFCAVDIRAGHLTRDNTTNCAQHGQIDVNHYSGYTLPQLKDPSLVGSLEVPEYIYNLEADNLSNNETFSQGDFLLSPSGSYRAVMQHDGNFVIYTSNDVPLWSSRTSGYGADCIGPKMQTDGNFVLYNFCVAGAPAIWSTRTNGQGSGTHMTMQDDGNLVIKNGSNTVVWASNTNQG